MSSYESTCTNTKMGIKRRGRNLVKRGLTKEPGEWKRGSFRHTAFQESEVVEIESE